MQESRRRASTFDKARTLGFAKAATAVVSFDWIEDPRVQNQAKLEIRWLGRRRYGEVWDLQKRMLEQRIEGEIGDTLLMVEHEPVYTWGKRTNPAHLGGGEQALRDLGADTFQVERGGEVTYHGPGQLVAYPICNLGNLTCGRDLHKYMRALEEVVIRVLDSYGLKGERVEGLTGVWVPSSGFRVLSSEHDNPEPAKIAALGVRVRKWCTMHGLALNVTNEVLPWFQHITPCGIGDRPVTTLESLLGRTPSMQEVRRRLVTAFERETGAPDASRGFSCDTPPARAGGSSS